MKKILLLSALLATTWLYAGTMTISELNSKITSTQVGGTLDLDGATIAFENGTGGPAITISKKITIQNGNFTSTINNGYPALYITCTDVVTFKSCTFASECSSMLYVTGNVTLDNCIASIEKLNNTTGTSGSRKFWSACVLAVDGGTITINGGTYSSAGACLEIVTSGGTITVNGGTFISTSIEMNSYCGAIYNDADQSHNGYINITGGTYKGFLFVRDPANNRKFTISGGTFDDLKVYKYGGSVISDTQLLNYLADANTEFVQENGKYIAVKKAAPDGNYSREVSADSWGTICLPAATTTISGAKFYSIVDKDASSITLEEHDGQLVACTPYIFKATGNTITATLESYSEMPEAGKDNGLIGTLGGVNYNAVIDDPNDLNDESLKGMYLVADNQLCPAKEKGSCLAPNRAYIDLAKINPIPATSPAQAARRVVLSTDGEGSVTYLNPVQTKAIKARKEMRNGTLYIRCDEQVFNAQGALVK